MQENTQSSRLSKEFSSGTKESILELVLMTSDIEAATGLGVFEPRK